MTPPGPWLDEIDLEAAGPRLSMGTRALGSRPWLVVDDRRGAELALKRRLIAAVPDAVLAVGADSERAGDETYRIVAEALVAAGEEPERPHPDRHPLEVAGRSVQEDLCLLRPGAGGWVLAAGSVCFPSRWRLGDKVGRSLTEVHQPVAGYRRVLAARVDRLLDRLDDRVVWRRNWFIHPDAALHQPDRPPGGDPVIARDDCLDRLHLRSERQTLRRLPVTGWILFTIRIQQVTVAELVVTDDRRAALTRFVVDADDGLASHRGLSRAQRRELALALA